MHSSKLSFYVTVGRGTESFAESEINKKIWIEGESGTKSKSVIQVRDGKVFFTLADGAYAYVETLMSFKCVERVFVMITDYENRSEGKVGFLNMLMKTMSTASNYSMAKRVFEQLASSVLQEREVKTLQKSISVEEPQKKKIKTVEDSAFPSDHLQNSDNCDSKQMDTECDSKVATQCFKTFRMSVKCSGKAGKWINVKKLSKDLSWRVSKASDWKVDLRNPDFEVSLHISDSHVTAGIPLTKIPLSRRQFMVNPGLRAPVAWIMTQLADIQPGDVILDPMCGKGTLLLEACSDMKDAYYLGSDSDMAQLYTMQHNVKSVDYQQHIDVLSANALCLPLQTGSVNKVICDAPFNQKYFTSMDEVEFYTLLLQEMSRVLKQHGRFILLTSQDLSAKIIPSLQQSPTHVTCDEADDIASLPPKSDFLHPTVGKSKDCLFQLVSKHYMKLGETHGEIIVMIKS